MKTPDLGQLAGLTRRAVRGWVDDAAPSMGAALAFYTLLSLAPLLLVALGIAGFFFDRNDAQDALIAQIAMLLGEKAAVGIEGLLDAAGTREGAFPAVVGLFTMILGATTVFTELRADLDRIWHYRPKKSGGLRSAFTTRFFAFLMVMVIGGLLMLSLVASTFLASVANYGFTLSPVALHAIEFFTSFVVVTLLFAMIYKLLPTQHVAWGDVWVGAAVTSLLFWIGKFLIALYISRTAVDSTFGAAGAIVLVIVWVYYSSQVFFLGAEFTKEYALRLGSKRLDSRPLSDMNATYGELVARAKRITRRNDPIFGK
ncbi:MAG TPA: YihY/virulence factor BrkB family protein [Usitatibacter sp.]|jgi:membrane protein|nr:YihY/virulence factor BrkB family protein [Usitatibacter sp.]